MPANDAPSMHCRVCGLLQPEAPWGTDGKTPNFDFCLCCGVQFGYQDSTIAATKKYRDEWMTKGNPWFEPSAKPHDWNLDEQMKQIPAAFK